MATFTALNEGTRSIECRERTLFSQREKREREREPTDKVSLNWQIHSIIRDWISGQSLFRRILGDSGQLVFVLRIIYLFIAYLFIYRVDLTIHARARARARVISSSRKCYVGFAIGDVQRVTLSSCSIAEISIFPAAIHRSIATYREAKCAARGVSLGVPLSFFLSFSFSYRAACRRARSRPSESTDDYVFALYARKGDRPNYGRDRKRARRTIRSRKPPRRRGVQFAFAFPRVPPPP